MPCYRPLTAYRSSPRPWRCFHGWIIGFCCVQVFSTSVEVFQKIYGAPAADY